MTLQAFAKQKDYLICVDSDGCAMDTMDIKHFRCFGPCMVEEWGLEQWSEPILNRWNAINLYSGTRGINRFKGLAMALTEIDKVYRPIEGVAELPPGPNTPPSCPTRPSQRRPKPQKVLPWPRPCPGPKKSTLPLTPCLRATRTLR